MQVEQSVIYTPSCVICGRDDEILTLTNFTAKGHLVDGRYQVTSVVATSTHFCKWHFPEVDDAYKPTEKETSP